MKKNMFIFVLLIMIGIKSYSQGMWDKVEVVTDKFHNIKQSVLVHCTAGEIDAVWYEDEQMLKYIGKFRLRCGSPWIAQQTCKPKDYHRTVHVFQ